MNIPATQTVDLTPEARRALVKYGAVRQSAWAVYEAAVRADWSADGAAVRAAWAAYEAVVRPVWGALEKAHPALGIAVRVHSTELAEVVGMLPCTLGALDAHADSHEWCDTWTRLCDDAIDEGSLVAVATSVVGHCPAPLSGDQHG